VHQSPLKIASKSDDNEESSPGTVAKEFFKVKIPWVEGGPVDEEYHYSTQMAILENMSRRKPRTLVKSGATTEEVTRQRNSLAVPHPHPSSQQTDSNIKL
jgi:hypothetical protein